MLSDPIPETLTDALVECIKAAGGSKVVGHKLFPEKMVDVAQRHLLNCTKEGRAERLSPDHVLMVFRLAREAGSHVGMAYMCHALGYAQPQPLEPKDEVAELQRQFVLAAKTMQAMATRLEQLQPQVQQAALKAVA